MRCTYADDKYFERVSYAYIIIAAIPNIVWSLQIMYIHNVYIIILMASTSNKNTPGNYALEQRINQNIDTYRTYLNSAAGEAYTNHLPGNGLLPGSIAPSQLCGNYCDVESQLRGIGSTNLVNPQTPVVPQLRTLDSLSIMTKLPVLLPEPLAIEPNQRYGYLQ